MVKCVLKSVVLFFACIFVLYGCCTLKKIKTVTTYTVDTVIVVKFDTVPVIREGTVHDTVYVENRTSIARSWISPKTGNLVISLQEKPFTVELKMNKTVLTKEKIPVRSRLIWYLFELIVILMIIAYILKTIKLKK